MDKGTFSFVIDHQNRGWQTDGDSYQFGPFERGTVGVQAIKHLDRTLEVRFAAEHFFHKFTGPMPVPSTGGIQVTVTWDKEIVLYINGQRASSAEYKPTSH